MNLNEYLFFGGLFEPRNGWMALGWRLLLYLTLFYTLFSCFLGYYGETFRSSVFLTIQACHDLCISTLKVFHLLDFVRYVVSHRTVVVFMLPGLNFNFPCLPCPLLLLSLTPLFFFSPVN